ncbi:MAG: hypothetical protein R3B99_05175 [Polyangiales bacterium]
MKTERDALVAEAHAEVAKRGGRFLGRFRAMRRSTRAWATSKEERNAVVPRVKAGRGQGEARRSALADDASFRWEMAECRLRMLRGEKDVVFPAGCFLWARRFGFATHAGVAPPLV